MNNNAATKIQKATRKHLARKGAFLYTHTWNKTFGEKVGVFPKYYPKSNQRYKRAGVFMKVMNNAMVNKNYKKPLYRGLTNRMFSHFKVGNGKMVMNRKTFSSFTNNLNKAREFSNGYIIKITGPVPSIKYNQKVYKSQYPDEAEVLLPPGIFTAKSGYYENKSHMIIPVTFSRMRQNINKLEKNANKRHPSPKKVVNRKNNNNESLWKLIRHKS